MRSGTPSSRRIRARPHRKIVSLVPPATRVLEFGCATGYMSEVLEERARLHGDRSRDLSRGRSARRAAHRARDRRRRGEDRLRRRARRRGVRRRALRRRARTPERARRRPPPRPPVRRRERRPSSPRSRTSRTEASASRSWAASSGTATGACSTKRTCASSPAPRFRISSRRPATWSRTGRGRDSTSGRPRSACRTSPTRCASGSHPIPRRRPTSSCSGRSSPTRRTS